MPEMEERFNQLIGQTPGRMAALGRGFKQSTSILTLELLFSARSGRFERQL